MLAVAGATVIAAPATAQDHSMPGMTMPMPAPVPAPRAPKPLRKPAPHRAPAPPAAAQAMRGMAMPGDPPLPSAPKAQGMDVPAPPVPLGTALPAGDAPPPPLPTDHYADRQFGEAAMAAARDRMMKENGAQGQSQVMVNLAEYQVHDGKAGYRWDGEGWFGGDIDRIVIKSEGSGTARDGVETAEAQLLYSHAIGPYFNLQAGVRHDLAPTPTRTDAVIGVEGLAPYEIQTEAAMFVSTKGEVTGRLEGWYDQRLTQRLVLQPRVELNLSAQDIPETRIGAGLADAEIGLRLRYEIIREFAPYVGLSYEAKTGRTADDARADRRDITTTNIVAGVRFWF